STFREQLIDHERCRPGIRLREEISRALKPVGVDVRAGAFAPQSLTKPNDVRSKVGDSRLVLLGFEDDCQVAKPTSGAAVRVHTRPPTMRSRAALCSAIHSAISRRS